MLTAPSITLSRRAFLQTLAMASLMASMPPFAFAKTPALHTRQLLMGTRKTSLGAYDLQKHILRETEIGFPAHSTIQNPTKPSQIVAIEKWGSGMAVLDLNEMRVVQPMPAAENTMYYGHGFYSEDGKIFFITRVDTKTGLGHFIGFDAETYKPIIDYQVTPGGLHECHRVDAGTAMVTSSGIRSNYDVHPQDGDQVETSGLVRVDMKSGRVLDKMLIDNRQQIMGHFRKGANGAIIAISGPKTRGNIDPGKIYFSKTGQSPLQEVQLPKDTNVKGEMLSVAFSNNGSAAAVTNPAGNLFFLLDGEQGRVTDVFDKLTHGVDFDPTAKEFVVSTTNKITGMTLSGKKWTRLPLAPELNTETNPLMARAHNIIV